MISEAAGVRKPDPHIFALALETLDVEPSRAAYVGDNPEADIGCARQSGLVAIWKRDPYWHEPAAADWVIDDLAEIPPLLYALPHT